MTVQFQELTLWIIGLGVPVITALAFALGKLLVDWVKTKTPFGFLVSDEMVRGYLQEAINFGIGYATQKAKESSLEVKFDNAFLATVLQYVVERVPDALEHFGITPTALEAMVKARLGLLAPEVASLPRK